MRADNFVMGIDFGTDSVRSIIVDAANGQEMAAAIFHYPRWRDGLYCDAAKNQFRQHPLDYIEGLEYCVYKCVKEAGSNVARNIRSISVDTTGSSPVAVDETGTPLAMLPAFRKNPNAMFILWKDHTAIAEAAQLNAHAASYGSNYLRFVGGIYSSEWFWAKLLHVLREDEAVRKGIHAWVEHCDWIPFLLTGGKRARDLKAGICAAGHKALWAEAFGGFPPNDFFASLDPLLDGFTDRLFSKTYTASEEAGRISPEWAARLGLNEDVIIGIGAMDAHMGAVGGQIEPYFLSKVMGTSTCDMLVAPISEVKDTLVKGICGQVPGSVIPGMMGMEAGQSAFGDAYSWFRNLLSWPLQHAIGNASGVDEARIQKLLRESSDSMLDALSRQAAALVPQEQSELAVDWLNGRRTPDANQSLKAAIVNLNLGTDAPKMFYAIAESTCFGARAIVERFLREGIPVKGLIGMGGVARKSPFIMQMMADVMNRPIRIHRSEQTCAMGAAMFAATAAGLYEKVEDAMQAMGQGFEVEYRPDPSRTEIYDKRFGQYARLGGMVESLSINE